jgi:protein gp37
MAEVSKIQWTHATFNAWRGCTKVSPGCEHCYAEDMSGRNPAVLGKWGKNGTRPVAAESYWKGPEKWNRDAAAEGKRRRVFCASLSDVFEGPDTMPESDGGYAGDVFHYVPTLNNDWIAAARERLFELIRDTPWLDWLLLTKRPQNVLPIYGTYLHWTTGGRWPANVWIGATIEDQIRAEKRGPELVKIRRAGCRVVFMSGEPLLSGLDMRPWLNREWGINWAICGGESGAADKIRPMDLMWARTLRDQCGDADVPYFFKQLGNGVVGLSYKGKGGDVEYIPEDLRVREFPIVA